MFEHHVTKLIVWILRDCICYWRALIVILVPLMLLPIPIAWRTDPPSISICAYILLLMAIYWVTEAIPITVTALIPLVAFPLLGVQDAKTVAVSYFPDVNFLFIGGLIMAIAVEEVNLHRRIALLVLLAMGSQPRWLLLGIMIATAFLSMFISNTATTAMMAPIVLTLATEIAAINHRPAQEIEVRTIANGLPDRIEAVPSVNTQLEEVCVEVPPSGQQPTNGDIKQREVSPQSCELRLSKALLIATCFSASIGGTATLTGTAPNLIMMQLLAEKYPHHPINYATWFGFSAPAMVVNLILAWIWLQIAFLGPKKLIECRRGGNLQIKQVVRGELGRLGRPQWAEISVIVIFLLLFLLWLTRKPAWGLGFRFGTTDQFPSDGTSSLLISVLLFLWPRQCPDFLCRSSRDGRIKPILRQSILTWQMVEKRLPWGIVFLLGGGFALGNGVSSTGLSSVIGNALTKLDVTALQLCVISIVITTYMTEFTSNAATSSILLPIVMSVAGARCINPLYLTLPVTEAASFAFMLPVATPPNAIVFRAGILRIRDMIWVGIVMNTLCMCGVLLSINTWGYAMFELGNWPDWGGNSTACTVG